MFCSFHQREKYIDRAHRLVIHEMRLTIKQFANSINIFDVGFGNILHYVHGMMKVYALWVPGLLTPDQNTSDDHIMRKSEVEANA